MCSRAPSLTPTEGPPTPGRRPGSAPPHRLFLAPLNPSKCSYVEKRTQYSSTLNFQKKSTSLCIFVNASLISETQGIEDINHCSGRRKSSHFLNPDLFIFL